MLPVFATNLIDRYLLEVSSALFLIQELITAFIRNRTHDIQTHDRASSFILLISLFMGISLGLNTSFSAKQFAFAWYRTLIFGIGALFL